MAVKEESLHHATDSLILPKPHLYYPADITTTHWQLRSLISSPDSGVVYYPSGHNVYALYPTTKEREIITTLPFLPLSLTVAGGWLCCGGHHKNYAAVSLEEHRTETNFFRSADSRLPLDLNPSIRSLLGDDSPRSRRFDYPLLANVKKIGLEEEDRDDAINNNITLWFPSDSMSDRVYKKPVAVLANNDKSVYILNLDDSEILQRLTYPDCVNRAVISPDGELLVAVLDDPFLYVHQRSKNTVSSPGLFNTREAYNWTPSCRLQLEGETQRDKSNMKGSFALSFSKSGKYLAAATQYGHISIFEVGSLTDEDAKPLSIFTSSRPGLLSGHGAVRSIDFSPGPLDLLAWTESTGRVGVADVRNLFLSRQLLLIDSHNEAVEKIEVTEREKPSDLSVIDPRLRSLRSESPSSRGPDQHGSESDRRQLRHFSREMLNRHQSPLTSEELEILQAHRIARRQRDSLADPDGDTNAAAYADYTRNTRALRTALEPETSGESSSTERRTTATGLPAAIRDFVNPDHRTAASFRSFINERNQDRERRVHRQMTQRQDIRTRSSAILAAAERAMEQDILVQDEAPGSESMTPPSDIESTSNPWAEIDALYRARFPDASLPIDRSARVRIEMESGGRFDEYDGTVFLRGIIRARRENDDSRPPETMGLSWSPDGRILYVGASDGIYEYHVNIAGRKMFPSIVLR